MKYILSFLCGIVLFACNSAHHADYVFTNARIYTIDDSFSVQQAVAIKGGLIVGLGNDSVILAQFSTDSIIDISGKTILPGLIDAHCHFLGYAKGLAEVNLFELQSEQDMIARVQAFAETHPEGWIVGRGWDQNKWSGKQFPSNTMLNQLFPNRPVYLVRVDGHAALVNQAALTLAGVNEQTSIVGGKLLQSKGKLTGLLIDKATELVEEKIENYQTEKLIQLLKNAEKNTFEVGLTTMVEAGLDLEDVLFLDSISQTGDLKSSIYAMLNPKPECFEYIRKHGFILHPNFWVQSVKVYADGALGSRGALLHHDYSDDNGNKGLLLYKASYFDSVASVCKNLGLQMNTHCIGDSSNSIILKAYAKQLQNQNDLRWRIEHAQVVQFQDLHYFKEFDIIPSIQPTHATSDMYWAGDRLGKQRIKTAYAYKDLLNNAQYVAIGSDFPVEHINPFYSLYAAVARKDKTLYPSSGFQIENALSREEAIKGMTIWAAQSIFKEKEIGSLEKGKRADFIVLDQDVMECDESLLFKTQVLSTYKNGKLVHALQ